MAKKRGEGKKRRIYKIILILFLCLAFSVGFWTTKKENPIPSARAQEPPAPPPGEYQRPNVCITNFAGGSGPITYYRCATLLNHGLLLHLWYGTREGPTNSERFAYVGNSGWTTTGSRDLGHSIYRSLERNHFYITVNDAGSWTSGIPAIMDTHHYDAGADKRWDRNPTPDDALYYTEPLFNEPQNLPNKEGLIIGNERAIWRIVVTGYAGLTLNNQSAEFRYCDLGRLSENCSFLKFKIDSENGPALAQEAIAERGWFDISKAGTDQDLWLSQFGPDGSRINRQIYLYVCLKGTNNTAYDKYFPYTFPAGFTGQHESDPGRVKWLRLNEGDSQRAALVLTEADAREGTGGQSQCREPIGASQSIPEEAGYTNWWDMILQKLAAMLADLFKALFGWIAHIGGAALDRNY